MLQHKFFTYLNNKNLTRVTSIELWWIVGKQKKYPMKINASIGQNDSLISIGQYLLTHGYRFIWLDDLTCLTIICKNENTVGEHG